MTYPYFTKDAQKKKNYKKLFQRSSVSNIVTPYFFLFSTVKIKKKGANVLSLLTCLDVIFLRPVRFFFHINWNNNSLKQRLVKSKLVRTIRKSIISYAICTLL